MKTLSFTLLFTVLSFGGFAQWEDDFDFDLGDLEDIIDGDDPDDPWFLRGEFEEESLFIPLKSFESSVRGEYEIYQYLFRGGFIGMEVYEDDNLGRVLFMRSSESSFATDLLEEIKEESDSWESTQIVKYTENEEETAYNITEDGMGYTYYFEEFVVVQYDDYPGTVFYVFEKESFESVTSNEEELADEVNSESYSNYGFRKEMHPSLTTCEAILNRADNTCLQRGIQIMLAQAYICPDGLEPAQPLRVFVQFVIEKDGSFSEIEVARSSGNDRHDRAAMVAVTKMPRVMPALVGDLIPVRMQYSVPLTLRAR